MVRRRFKEKREEQLETEPEFRYRGDGASRLENLSDTVFGFGITLLIVSLQVPESFEELKGMFDGFFAFGIAVLLFFGLWYEHYIFFIRYGLKDRTTVILNGVLLFVLLFFIYPLKFLVSIFIEVLKAGWAYLFQDGAAAILRRIATERIASEEVPELMVLYGLGGAAVYLLFASLYYNAWRKSTELELNRTEERLTQVSMIKNLFAGTVPLLSASCAFFIGPATLAAPLAGAVYSLMGFMAFFGRWEKRVRKAAASSERSKEGAGPTP